MTIKDKVERIVVDCGANPIHKAKVLEWLDIRATQIPNDACIRLTTKTLHCCNRSFYERKIGLYVDEIISYDEFAMRRDRDSLGSGSPFAEHPDITYARKNYLPGTVILCPYSGVQYTVSNPTIYHRLDEDGRILINVKGYIGNFTIYAPGKKDWAKIVTTSNTVSKEDTLLTTAKIDFSIGTIFRGFYNDSKCYSVLGRWKIDGDTISVEARDLQSGTVYPNIIIYFQGKWAIKPDKRTYLHETLNSRYPPGTYFIDHYGTSSPYCVVDCPSVNHDNIASVRAKNKTGNLLNKAIYLNEKGWATIVSAPVAVPAYKELQVPNTTTRDMRSLLSRALTDYPIGTQLPFGLCITSTAGLPFVIGDDIIVNNTHHGISLLFDGRTNQWTTTKNLYPKSIKPQIDTGIPAWSLTVKAKPNYNKIEVQKAVIRRPKNTKIRTKFFNLTK